MQGAGDLLFHLTDLLLWNPTANQLERTLFARALTCKQCQGEDAWHRVAMLMESDIEFTNSDKGTQIAFSLSTGPVRETNAWPMLQLI